MDIVARSERNLYALALILAPLLLAISTFFWQGGRVDYAGGMIQVYSFVFWIPAMLGLLSLLRPTMPSFSVWATLLVSLVCIVGSNFGMEGIYRASFQQAGADGNQLTALDEAMAVAQIVVLRAPGLFFPLALVIISFLLWRSRTVPPLFALLLCLGAIAFPLSRIPRIEIVAHVADLLLLVGAGGIGWLFWQGQTTADGMARVVGFGND